jgi:hypothetical protein
MPCETAIARARGRDEMEPHAVPSHLIPLWTKTAQDRAADGCRRLGRLQWPSEGALDGIEFSPALDEELKESFYSSDRT